LLGNLLLTSSAKAGSELKLRNRLRLYLRLCRDNILHPLISLASGLKHAAPVF
jgi:hypothetical protein